MIISFVDSALYDLAMLSRDSSMSPSMETQIQNLQLELRFLKMFFWCSRNMRRGSEKQPLLDAKVREAMQGLCGTGSQALSRREFQNWDHASSMLLKAIEQYKPKLQETCMEMAHYPFNHMICSKYKLMKFFHFVSWNLKDLVGSRPDMIVDVKFQMKTLEEKLCFCRDFFSVVGKRCVSCHVLADFIFHVQAWVYKTACLSILYWVNENDQEMMAGMSTLLSDLLQQMEPCTPEVTKIYFEVLKATKPLSSEILLMSKVVSRFADFLLENLVAILENHDIEMFRQSLIFLLTFLMNPPEPKDFGKVIWCEITDLVNEAASLFCTLRSEELGKIISMFLEKIDIVRSKVRQCHVQIPNTLTSDFPRTNAMGFLEFFLRNLKEVIDTKANFIPFAKFQIGEIHKELVSLWRFLEDALRLQTDDQGLGELSDRIVNVAYEAEHVIDSCSIIDAPIWYNLIRLSDVIAKMQLVKDDVKNSRAKKRQDNRILNTNINPRNIVRSQVKTRLMDDVIVGFTTETETIIDQLIRGSTQLGFVSIVGVPGQGKTTLANKAFDDPFVRYYFHKRAWCCVTRVYDCKELLRSILNDLVLQNDKINATSAEELPEMVYRCLKGQRYLIVLDDIWDISGWDELKFSFPNDNNGSRILFTSRIQKVALQAKFDCSLHLLRPLTDEESWELLEKKLFGDGDCPPNLSNIGQQVAKNCKGLPLAVVLVGGLLTRNVMCLDWWKHIADSVNSHISREGFKDLIELSYNHLPESLRPCFLYFGAFREGQAIRVQKLIRIWIAEGFVEQSRMKTMEDVAKEYLMELIDRSLVKVTKSSIGGIKECHVHDMLHDFCLVKAEEERFLHVPNVSHYSSKRTYDQYRLSIRQDWRAFVRSESSVQGVRSLLFNGNRKEVRYLVDTGNSVRCAGMLSFIVKFKLLKVLDLEDVALANSDFLKCITSLVHLRYLTVSGCVSCVPSSIDNLCSLEIFHIRSNMNCVQLPKAIWKVKSLRHVHVNRPLLSADNHGLRKFPQLEDMETFSRLWLTSEEDAEKLFRLLPNVRELGVRFTFNAQIPLNLLRKLETLDMSCDWRSCFPWPFDFPSNLKGLSLHHTNIQQRHISRIGRLPNLEVLKLEFVYFEPKTWNIENEEFLKLKFLKLKNCGIEQWNASTDHLPCLERVVVNLSHFLEKIPSSFGAIATLNMIEIHHCKPSVVNSVKGILVDQFDMGNTDFVAFVNGEEMKLLD